MEMRVFCEVRTEFLNIISMTRRVQRAVCAAPRFLHIVSFTRFHLAVQYVNINGAYNERLHFNTKPQLSDCTTEDNKLGDVI
jgi:hypothetical protein